MLKVKNILLLFLSNILIVGSSKKLTDKQIQIGWLFTVYFATFNKIKKYLPAGGVFEKRDITGRVAFAYAVDSLNGNNCEHENLCEFTQFIPVIHTIPDANSLPAYKQGYKKT